MAHCPFPKLSPQQLSALQARFLDIKPSIEKHGRIYFRFVRCKQRLADLIAEMVALGWKYSSRPVNHTPHCLGNWRKQVCGGRSCFRSECLRDHVFGGVPSGAEVWAACQRCGSSSFKCSTGCVGRRASTSRR